MHFRSHPGVTNPLNMSPLLRRALHEALDHVLDAINAEAQGQAEAPKPVRKRQPRCDRKHPPVPADADPFTIKRAQDALKRVGLL